MTQKDKHIDNVSLKELKGYVAGTLHTSERERVQRFLEQHPEMEEVVKELTLADLGVVSNITSNVNSRIDQAVGGKKSVPYGWIAVAAVLAVGVTIFVSNSSEETQQMVEENVQPEKNILVPEDTAVEEQESIVFTDDDTLYNFELKGNNIHIEEKVREEVYFTEKVKANEPDDLIVEVKDTVVNEEPLPKEDNGFKPIQPREKVFSTSIAYRQSAEVEDEFYSQSKTMGKTTAYAAPIKGYVYEEEGMPYFGSSDEDLMSFIQNRLDEDELLEGINRKMKANLSFMVTSKGKIKDVLIQNCNHRQLGLSLANIMEQMPDWNPAEKKGKKGKVHYVLTITYK